MQHLRMKQLLEGMSLSTADLISAGEGGSQTKDKTPSTSGVPPRQERLAPLCGGCPLIAVTVTVLVTCLKQGDASSYVDHLYLLINGHLVDGLGRYYQSMDILLMVFRRYCYAHCVDM